MATFHTGLDGALGDYIREFGVHETDLQRALREETAGLAEAAMQISPEQGGFMALLVKLMGARQCLEVGTFTGYSALTVAAALPEGGRLVCCDVSEEWTAVGRRYWERAGVADRIDLRIAPALETLDCLLADGAAGSFDFAFIDADKENYDGYYERCLRLVRPGGAIAVDNVLWSGKVADPEDDSETTRAIRALNEKIAGDDRVEACLLTIGDGLTLARVV